MTDIINARIGRKMAWLHDHFSKRNILSGYSFK